MVNIWSLRNIKPSTHIYNRTKSPTLATPIKHNPINSNEDSSIHHLQFIRALSLPRFCGRFLRGRLHSSQWPCRVLMQEACKGDSEWLCLLWPWHCWQHLKHHQSCSDSSIWCPIPWGQWPWHFYCTFGLGTWWGHPSPHTPWSLRTVGCCGGWNLCWIHWF